jgi:hypothetical protein
MTKIRHVRGESSWHRNCHISIVGPGRVMCPPDSEMEPERRNAIAGDAQFPRGLFIAVVALSVLPLVLSLLGADFRMRYMEPL